MGIEADDLERDQDRESSVYLVLCFTVKKGSLRFFWLETKKWKEILGNVETERDEKPFIFIYVNGLVPFSLYLFILFNYFQRLVTTTMRDKRRLMSN